MHIDPKVCFQVVVVQCVLTLLRLLSLKSDLLQALSLFMSMILAICIHVYNAKHGK